MILIVSLLVFMAVVLGVVGFIYERRSAAEKAMLGRVSRGGGIEQMRAEAVRDDRYSSVPWFDRLLRALNLGQRLELMLYQAGMNMRAGVLVLLIALCAMLGYLGGMAFFHRIFPALLTMAVLTPVPYVYVQYRKGQRMKAFSREFPDSLDLLVSALRAGLSFSSALQIVAEESPDPVRGEFAITVEEQSLGVDVREALVNLSDRVDSLDLRFFVTAVLLQRETGGNLAEVLANTASLIRDRFRILGDIQTFTAQGRLTGWILSLLPLAMALYTVAITPKYFQPMFESHSGRVALIVAGSMQLLGMLIIRKIVRIRV